MKRESRHRINKHRVPTATCAVSLHTQPKQRTQSYQSLVAAPTGWSLTEEEAEWLWLQEYEHKLRVSVRAKDISMERAAADYFKRLRLGSLNRTGFRQAGQTFPSDLARDGRE